MQLQPASISEASALSQAKSGAALLGLEPLVKEIVVTRLNSEVYRKFEDSLPRAVIDRNAQDSGCDASFKLGIQFVLQRLRTELAVE